MASIGDYYQLMKPGIVYGNTLHYAAGVFVVANLPPSPVAIIGGLVGTMLVIGSSCVVNNYIDRDIDRKMERTKNRPSATGAISLGRGVALAVVTGMLGLVILALTTNLLTIWLNIALYVSYALFYTYSKRYTVHHTLIGAIPGSLPAVIGGAAVANSITSASVWMFALVGAWQLVHFYSIGLYQRSDYEAAGIPLLTKYYSEQRVQTIIIILMVVYGFMALGLSIDALGVVGRIGLGAGVVWWLVRTLKRAREPVSIWARSVFFDSLTLAMLLAVVTCIDMIMRVLQITWQLGILSA